MTRLALLLGALLALTGCASTEPPTPLSPAGLSSSAAPVAVSIPAIGATDEVVPVGLDAEGAMEVPPVDVVGWYRLGVTPGELGPAVLAGHVNYEGALGAFSRLGELKPGNEVTVTGQDGSVRTFEVYDVVTVPKDRFDYRLVYGDTEGPELRLVTCSGPIVDRSYLDNTIVAARLVT